MELEEHGHKYRNDSIEHECKLDQYVRRQLLLVLVLRTVIVRIKGPLDALEPGVGHGENNEVGEDEDVGE